MSFEEMIRVIVEVRDAQEDRSKEFDALDQAICILEPINELVATVSVLSRDAEPEAARKTDLVFDLITTVLALATQFDLSGLPADIRQKIHSAELTAHALAVNPSAMNS